MIELDDLTYNEFLTSDKREEYIFAAKYAKPYLKPIDVYNIGELYDLTWGFVKDIQYDLEQNEMSWDKMIDFICQATGKDPKEIGKAKFKDVCNFRMYLIEGVQNLMKVEEQMLSHIPTENEKEAGIGLFENMGIFIQTDALASKDILKHDDVKKLKYSNCLIKLIYMKQQKEFDDRLTQLNSNSYNQNNT